MTIWILCCEVVNNGHINSIIICLLLRLYKFVCTTSTFYSYVFIA